MSGVRPSAKFFEGQKPPEVPMMSQDNIDWYKEMKRRCFEGFEFRGTRFTGDQWWFYNMCPMPILKLDRNGNPTGDFGFDYPYWSQVDDYLFKQIEEAEQSNLGVPLMTHRGMGKTQIILSIGGKIFFFKQAEDRLVHGIIAGSEDAHVLPTFMKFSQLVRGVNKKHPSIELDLLKDNSEEVIAGATTFENGKWKTENRALMEKIVFGNSADKTRGRRLDFYMKEEIGAWLKTASLKDCMSANRGSMWLGNIKVCRDFYIGTGGNVMSDQAKEIMFNPESFELYPVVDHENRKRGIVVLAYQKHHGLWEKTGFNDDEKAKEELNKIRAIKKLDPDPEIYNKFIQEYPFTIEEMFMKGGGNRFDLEKISKALTTYQMFPEKRPGEWGDLEWIKKDGIITGVSWHPNVNGKMWLREKPVINPTTGQPYQRLYVGGYDGIDVGTKDTSTGKGSSGAFSIKKRLAPGLGIGNAYVFFYKERPHDVETFFEGCHKAMVFFGMIKTVNIEDSKRGIVGYLKNNRNQKGLIHLMHRPKLTLNKVDYKKQEDEDKESDVIGTAPTPKNFEYGETFLIRHIKEESDLQLPIMVLEDLRDFTMDSRTKHDLTVSMFMAELADDEYMDKPVIKTNPVIKSTEEWGYFTDSKGIKRWGKVPAKKEKIHFAPDSFIDFVNLGKKH